MKVSSVLLTLLSCSLAAAHRTPRNHDTHDYFVVQLNPTASPYDVAASLGAHCEGPVGQLANHYTYSVPKHTSHMTERGLEDIKQRRRKRSLVERAVEEREAIVWHQKQVPRQRLHKRIPPPLTARQGPTTNTEDGKVQTAEQVAATERREKVLKTLNMNDPIFREQWHLFNTDQIGHDLNVTGVWLDGITGNGSTSVVVDDGLDLFSDDLKDNYYAAGSWDFNDPGPDPKPRLFDDKHGTRCAGEIAAVKNDVCGVGMAYDSKIAGVRILSKVITDEDEALAMTYDYQNNQIFSCSWGPPDDGKAMEVPGILVRKAMFEGIQNGRGGLGTVYVFAAGNGAASDDNCNFDGYTNSIYSITVGAIDREGNHPYYSEACSAQLVVTYSSGAGGYIHTTDVGEGVCAGTHGGTSAAGPLVVGVVALALSARPDLSWRDLQYIAVNTAIPFHENDSEWQETTIGKKFSHQYGYGKVDTWRFVEAAKTFEPVKPQAWFHSPWLSVLHDIPQGDQGLASEFEVTKDMLTNANFERMEHVTVTMNVNHTRRGDLSVELRSPSGIVSHLSTPRRLDDSGEGYEDWNFMSVAHWGEDGIGKWTVIVKDTIENDNTGIFIDWRLNFWGECINPEMQSPHPVPDEHEDDHQILPAPVVTTSIDPGSAPTGTPGKPSDHPDRPTKPKPSGDEDVTDVTTTAATSTTPTAVPDQTTTTTFTAPTATHTTSDSFLPSFFPKFGMSKRTQIWVYGSIALMLLFCIGLGVYFFMQKRRRLQQSPRDDYEFELVGDEDDGAATMGLTGKKSAKKAAKKRGGELYDAFAGESDEELFSDASDEEPYRDEKNDKFDEKFDEKAGYDAPERDV